MLHGIEKRKRQLGLPLGLTYSLDSGRLMGVPYYYYDVADLVTQAQTDLNITQGEAIVFTADIPDLPQQYASVMVAQADQAQAAPSNRERAVGSCYAIDYNWSGKGWSGLSPNAVASEYFWRFENKSIDVPPITSAELVTLPQHGKVVYFLEKDGLSYPRYIPDLNYIGDDKVTFKVNVDGTIVKVVMLIKVTDKGADTEGLQESICKNTGNYWKISQDANGNPVLTAIAPAISSAPVTTLTSTSLNDWLSLAQLDAKVADMSGLMSSLNVGTSTDSGITVNVADLSGAAVGDHRHEYNARHQRRRQRLVHRQHALGQQRIPPHLQPQRMGGEGGQ